MSTENGKYTFLSIGIKTGLKASKKRVALPEEGGCSKGLFGKPKETGENLYDAGVVGKTAVEWYYNKQSRTDCTEFTCFRLGTNGKIL
jgi:hypothetical protein